jgi:hypothetical protein
MQIKEIIIYGRNGKKRELKFSTGTVNIISGYSKTGKTAVGQIVDYCLGSKTCDISAGVVRNYSAWYALIVTLNSEEIFIARKNPDKGQESISASYYSIEKKAVIPDKVNWAPNCDSNILTKILSDRLGIEENIHFTTENQTRDELAANIRHSLFYCFQFQYELASPKNLFHRQDEDFVTQTIKDTFPYFAGVVQKNQIELKERLRDLTRKLEIIEKKENERISIQGGKKRALALLQEAESVGLVDRHGDKDDLNIEELYMIISKIESNWKPEIVSSKIGMDDLSSLQSQLALKQDKKEQLNIKIESIGYIINNSGEYNNEITEQKHRLQSIDLFSKLNFEDKKCPFCSAEIKSDVPSIESIKDALVSLDKNLNRLNADRLNLRKYYETLLADRNGLDDEISNLKGRIDALYQTINDAKQIKDIVARQGKVVGRISLWMESYKKEDINDTEKTNLETQIKKIQDQLSEFTIQENLNSVLSIISADMTKWAKELDLEYKDCPYRFNLNAATVIVDSLDGSVPLRKLGSGSNWVGVHLLAYFAIQKYFIETNRPVPNFLVIDQPSQIYFPKSDQKTDFEKVKEIYRFIDKRVKELNGKLQVIVLDHADFPDMKEFNGSVLERWDESNGLIPNDWLQRNPE